MNMYFKKWVQYLFGFWLYAICTAIPSFALSQPHAYLQVQGGIGGMFTKNYSTNDNPYNKVSLKNGLAYRLSAGALIDKNLIHYGLEFGYAGYPQNNYTFSFPSLLASGEQKYTGHYVDLLGVVKYDLTDLLIWNFYLTGKAGVAYVTQKYSGHAQALGTLFELSNTVYGYEPDLALGVGYNFTKNLSLDVNYQHIFGNHADPDADPAAEQNDLTQISAVNTLLIGISYHF